MEKYSSNEQLQQLWNWPALGSLAMQLKVYGLYCCIVNIHHVVPDDKAGLTHLGNLSNGTHSETDEHIHQQHFKQNRWRSVLPQSTLQCNNAY